MPLFEYRCLGCGGRFEVLVGCRSDRPAHPRCPQCGNTRTTGLVTAARSRSAAGGVAPACNTGLGGG